MFNPVPKPKPKDEESNVERWVRVRKALKEEFQEKGITTCEICRVIGKERDCWKNNGLSFHHRHKRIYYDAHPELLGDFNHVVLACPVGHNAVEYDRELNRKVFKDLRNDE